ncbi:membrane protein [Streptomyces phage TurkishDelight]|uniref:Membrane protein n=1 Tax=Streptomyces phage TurkishDelight TaxID=2793708 RepID=A0A7T0Q587_9CAUD|nr:membrane protein [Streptomyces phage TurkishDelight]QPL14094.1 membrane protein [Streptomyces phage TurkishDelight]
MSTGELWTTVWIITTALETFPVWGPVLAVVTAVLLVHSTRRTGGTAADDGQGDGVPAVPLAVSAVEDAGETTSAIRLVTCGDAVPRMSSERETGGA